MVPPITARPRGARKSAPSPRPRATGIMPAIRAMVVIRIGRRRTRPASIRASRREFAHHVDDILVFLQDVLMPRKLEAHLDDGFQAVREALRRRIGVEK